MRKLVCLGLVFWLTTATVHASGDFQTNITVNYKFNAQGASTVTEDVALTNNTTEKYAQLFQLTLPDGSTKNVHFDQPVVGRGQTQNFSLNFAGPPALHNGQIWEITLPPAPNSDAVDNYVVTLQTDPALGNLAFMTPPAKKVNQGIYIFNKNQIDKVGITAAFGNFQTFGFNLRYQLRNSQNRPVFTEIALPADSNYQRVFYDILQPSPSAVRVDEDGNWLARYDLQPSDQLQIVATGQVHLLAEPSRLLSEPETEVQLSKYLQPTRFWPVISTDLKTPEEIYNYVVTHLKYDFASINHQRQGASLTLSSGVCTEFTDLFVALARSAGIPAREVEGFAYTTEANRPLSLGNDVLHAWPQYWDVERQMWINIDPTWGYTTSGVDYFHKLDFDHFAFVTHGVSDAEPLAAGFYKTEASQKTVQVDFANFRNFAQANLAVDWPKPWQIWPLGQTQSHLTLTNPSGQAIYNTTIELLARNLRLNSPTEFNLAVIPPFGQVRLPLVLAKGQYFNFRTQSLTVGLPGQNVVYNVEASLYLLWNFCGGFIFSALLVGLAFIAGRTRSIYFQKPRSGHSVRG